MTNRALPESLYRAASVRELDRVAIEELGIPGATLMARAGQAAFERLPITWPSARGVAVVCGAGNNAGDGYVVARLARERDMDVRVFELGDPERLSGDALGARAALTACGVSPQPFEAGGLGGDAVVVDAIFGTGLDREVAGHWRSAIDAVNAAGAPVLALDIPSGLHADTGRVLGAGVRADVTVSFIGLKQGMFSGEGPEQSGRVHFDALGVPAEIYRRRAPDAFLDRLERFRGLLPPRPRHAHKGRFGHVLVIGGDAGFTGAARLAGEAALRCGAGLVSVATRAAHAHSLNAGRPEIMAHGVETGAGLVPLLERAGVLATGPGLGRSEWARQMLGAALAAGKPVVLDADGLNLLAEAGGKTLTGNCVITPHPGEAGRLLGSDAAAVEADRFAASAALAARFGCTAVLKGAGTLTSAPDGATWVCADGNPGMASGGMGDVLSGVIAALMAQGLEARHAARAGVCLHARAGDLAAEGRERGTLASDLMPLLRMLVNEL